MVVVQWCINFFLLERRFRNIQSEKYLEGSLKIIIINNFEFLKNNKQ
jgi:hypothetical protein